MNGYEKIANIIQSIAKNNQSSSIELGIYRNDGIETHNITIPNSMILKLDYLDKKRATKVSGQIGIGGAGDEAHTHEFIDTSEYIDELKDGDTVAYQIINNTKVLILGRVV